jgi:hypothetical protein
MGKMRAGTQGLKCPKRHWEPKAEEVSFGCDKASMSRNDGIEARGRRQEWLMFEVAEEDDAFMIPKSR